MRSFVLTGLMLSFAAHAFGQLPTSFRVNAEERSLLPKSNSINDILVAGDTIWIGSGRGLSQSVDGGKRWKNFANVPPFESRGISALARRGNTMWVASAYSERRNGDVIQIGAGLHYSTDGGTTWRFVKQPVDTGTVDTLTYGRNRIAALAITVPENNVTFDIALTSNTVWIASFAGMLRKSTNNGQTWDRVILPPDGSIQFISPDDSLNFDLSPSSGRLGLRENLNHRVFSVLASNDSTIWVGTAGGINKSTDRGISWRKFNHQNQLQPISGNFVVALAEQSWNGKQILWAATINAVDANEKRGVSFTEDGGNTWRTTLIGDFPHNFAFRDSIVYVAADGGLYRSANIGKSWSRSGTVFDPQTLQRFGNPKFYSVGVQGDTVWVGTNEGLAYTIDSPSEPFATRWTIFRTYEPVGPTTQTYSYPLPFSPDDEVVRIHYGTQGKTEPVTIRIFDFSMQPVRTLIQGAVRSGSHEHDEIWNGMDDLGRRVANGVYFYRIEYDGNEIWGKIMVLQ